MPNHVHMIDRVVGKFNLSEILRDLKKFTVRAIVNKLEQDKPKGYMEVLKRFTEAGRPLKRITTYQV